MKELDVEVINRFARREGLSLGNAEKEYALSVALLHLSKFSEFRKMAFKGGTCLKKAYFPEFRFSSDLDFSSKTENAGLQSFLTRVFQNKTLEGVKFTKILKLERTKQNLSISLQYESQISGAGHVYSIRIESSRESEVMLPLQEKQILNPPEFELPPSFAYCLDLREILAEKIHAIYHRPKPRDLHDLDFLLAKGIAVDESLIEAKLKPIDKKLEFNSFKERMNVLGERWERDLRQVMQKTPDFQQIQGRVTKKLFNAEHGTLGGGTK